MYVNIPGVVLRVPAMIPLYPASRAALARRCDLCEKFQKKFMHLKQTVIVISLCSDTRTSGQCVERDPFSEQQMPGFPSDDGCLVLWCAFIYVYIFSFFAKPLDAVQR